MALPSTRLEVGGCSPVLGEKVDDRCSDHRGDTGRETPFQRVELVCA